MRIPSRHMERLIPGQPAARRALCTGVTLIALACFSVHAVAADLVVSAASSLTNVFQEIGKAYERVKPDERVLFNFAASGSLLQQIARGAPVDVFASADQQTMDRAEKQNLIYRDSRVDFADNKVLLMAPGGSTLQLRGLSDLAGAGVQRIALGNPDSVPAGRYAKQALEKAGLWEQLLPKYVYTQNVRQSLDYVFRGEVDAGFVYATDAAVSPVKVKVAAEVPLDAPVSYPIAVVKGFGSERRGRLFIEFVRSDSCRKILARYGFLQP